MKGGRRLDYDALWSGMWGLLQEPIDLVMIEDFLLELAKREAS